MNEYLSAGVTLLATIVGSGTTMFVSYLANRSRRIKRDAAIDNKLESIEQSMVTAEKLDLVVDGLNGKINIVKEDVSGVKSDVSRLKDVMDSIARDVTESNLNAKENRLSVTQVTNDVAQLKGFLEAKGRDWDDLKKR